MGSQIEFLVHHGYAILAAVVLAEQLGAPIPAIPVLLAMGALIARQGYSFVFALALATGASVAADSAWYLLGRQKGQSVINLLCRISLEPDSCVSSTRRHFKTLGDWSLLIAKFVPGISTLAPPMAGLARMRWTRFLLADTAGSIAWAGAFLTLGYMFSTQLEDVALVALHLGSFLVAAVIALLGLWIGFKYWKRRRFIKSLWVARIEPDELQRRLSEVVLIDLRTDPERADQLPGAIWFDQADLEKRHNQIPRDRDVVLYCT